MRPRPTNAVTLTNRQIERYSRQIIVEKFGGVAQERLIAARILLVSDNADAEAVLAYLVGAGVGNIDLRANLDVALRDAIVARMRDLNSDSTVAIGAAGAPELANFDLAIAIVGDAATLDQARALCDRRSNFAIVLARVDQPAKLAVISARPPCPQCASAGELLAPIGPRADNAGFIATLAVLEAMKLLIRYAPTPKPTLVEFSGYESSARIFNSVAGAACGCDAARAAKVPR